MSDRYAPPGFIWQCQACGKTSDYDSYGTEGKYSRGWDESCALNCALIPDPKSSPPKGVDHE